MAPGGGGKRKRGDRNYSFDSRDDHSRPSPHRPGSLSLGQHASPQQSPQQQYFNRDQYDQRGGGRRRGSRGGRGAGSQRSPINSPNAMNTQPRPTTGPQTSTTNPAVQPPQPTETFQTPHTQSPPNSKTTATQTQEQTPSELPLYAYEYVTDIQRQTWAETGRAEVVAAGCQACQDKDQTKLYLLFQDLIRAGLDNRIEGADAGSVVREIVESVHEEEPVEHTSRAFRPDEVFLDILSICSEAWNVSTSLKPIVFATNISAQLMRLILDSSLLESLGLIRSTFVRVGIRQQTNVLYRQSNYNLLREETEGYSKLITELFTTSSGEALSSEVVEETFERVKGMIGAFDLDVGRVLDVTLDVFAAVLVKQYRFFVKYLRVSSWWPLDPSSDIRAAHGLGTLPKWALPGEAGRPMNDDEKALLATARDQRDEDFWQRVKEIGINAFFEIGNRKAASGELKQALESAATIDSLEAGEDQVWMETTGTLPPVGNKVAAQILGFKLRFYSSSARDASDQLPLNIIYLAALLIKIGFISLRDLYPHLWPSDDAMDGIKQAKLKENAEKERLSRPGASAQNALLMAGALTDERVRKRDLPTAAKAEAEGADATINATAEEKEKDELPEPAEQKVQLLKSLLCIGAIPESLYMLGRFPWLIDTFSELPEHLHRILHHCLNKVYEPLRPLSERSDLREQPRLLEGEQSAVGKGQLRFVDAPPRKVMRWAQIDKDDTNEGIDYKFYWDDWADSVPVCQTIDDVFLLCSTFLNFTGVKIGQDSSLLVKLCRIGRHSLHVDRSEANTKRWTDLCKRILVPALSLTKSNPGVANEVFELIREFSLHTRYSFYAEWFQGQTSRLPEVKAALDRARSETRDVLKRISKSNLKSMARALAKIAYSSPGAVFQLAISQIEIYENFAETFTECARYLTYLAYDVFNWALLSAVGGGGKSRVQADGMLTSHWLQSLTVFISKVYKRYPVMSPVPMLQYVLDQLTRGNSVDLIVLEEMVTTMAGIISDTNFNDNQVVAMGGGEQLQAQTMLQLLDRRHELKPTAKRLMRCLAEPKLAGQLLVAIAQERENCVYNLPDKDAPAKLLGNLFDEVHRVLTQYLDFMRTNLSVGEFGSLVPGVSDLILQYGVQPGVAFWISRTSVGAAMAEYDSHHPNNPSNVKLSPVKELVEAEALKADSQSFGTGQASQTLLSTGDNSPRAEVEKPFVETKDTEQANTNLPNSSPTSEQSQPQQPWHPVLREIMDSLRQGLPSETWEYLSPSFYVTFWQLSLCDLQVPAKSYQQEQDRLKAKVDHINKDRTDVSMAGTQRKEREKKLILDLVDRLASEHKERVNAYQRTRVQLGKEKTSWFADMWGRWDESSDALIEHCFFPRIRLSSVDALYAFKMYQFLHSSATVNFRTVKFLDRIFTEKRLENMLFLCSAKEAEHLGRFLREVLKDLARWHASKTVFEREAFGTKKELKGFCVKMSPGGSNDVYMDFEDFRRIFNKWHRNINIALKTCFSSGEYMHIRNAINISKAIVEHFPAVNWMGNMQAACVERLSKTEVSRPDLQLAAASLLGNIRRREKAWVLPQAFALSPNDHATNGASIARSTSAKPSTPQPEPDASKPLNPKASSFEPRARATVDSASKPGRPGDVDAEDGEIEDSKMADAIPNAATTTSAIQNGSDAAKSPLPAPVTTNGSIQQAPADAAMQTNPMVSSKNTPAPTYSQPPLVSEKRPAHQEGTAPNPSLNQASPISRPEPGRTTSSPSTNGRLQHILPDRPEAPSSRPVSHRAPDRYGERASRDTGRDQRFASGPVEDYRSRPSDREVPGQQVRGHDPSHGRAQVSASDLRARPDHDVRSAGPVRSEARPPGDVQQPYSRDKQAGEQRPIYDPKLPDTASRNSAMPPPRSSVFHHADRVALIHGNRNPDRPPLNNRAPERRSELPRLDGYTTPDRSSRGASPARSDDQRPLRNDSRRDVRHDDRPSATDRRAFSDSAHGPSRHDEGHPPAGPRTDRLGNYGQPGLGDRFQESLKPSINPKPTIDLNHGRLNQDSSYSGQRSEQYGRLNSGSEVPSGPRMPNGNHASSRNPRNVSAPQPQLNTQSMPSSTQNVPQQSPTMDKQTPTGPSSDRAALPRHAAPNTRQIPASTSTPPTPVPDSPDTAGIHPDRLKALVEAGSAMPAPIPPAQNPNSIQIQGSMGRPPSRPQPQQQQQQQQQPQQQPLPPVTVPRGPSNQQIPASPTGPSPTNRGPPTGPGRSDKRFAGIQGVLQQANSVPNGPDRSGQGASIRGRGGRPNNASTHSPSNSAPPTPSTSQRPDQFQQRGDLFAGRNGGLATPPNHPADDGSAYDRNGRRGPSRDAGVERDDARDGRENFRGSSREGGRDNSDLPESDRRSLPHPSKAYPPRSSSRREEHDYDARQSQPPSHQPSRREEGASGGIRSLRSDRGGPAIQTPAGHDINAVRDSYRGARGEVDMPPRDRRGGPPDRRDSSDWGRGDRDRRDGGGSGRKRGRPAGDEAMTMGGSAEKRARRGP
ncbi:THO2 plays a role in transcriptional elongation [Xanthoria parietina]